MNLKEALQGKLTEKELSLIQKSYETIGDIAIISIDSQLESKKMLIAETLAEINKGIKVVLRKTAEVSGEYRVGKYEVLLGDRTETLCTESGCRFKLDPTKVYFTSKLSGERLRIAGQVKDGERILCMFAGVGPYPIVIVRQNRKKDIVIYAVEINKDAFNYMRENILLNNVYDKVVPYCGDVRDVVPELEKTGKKFDRILMPAPKSAEKFLPLALKVAKKNTIIHLYTFAREDGMKQLPKKITAQCKKLKRRIKILNVEEAGAFAPRVWRVAVDFKVLN